MSQKTVIRLEHSVIRFILKALFKHRLLALLTLFFSLGWAFDQTIFPLITRWIIDTLIDLEDRSVMWHALFWPLLIGAAFWITVEGFYRLSGVMMARLLPSVQAEVRMRLFHDIQKHSVAFFQTHQAGSIANRLSNMSNESTRIIKESIQLFLPFLIAIIISLVLFAALSPFFALILAAWLILHLSICLSFAKRSGAVAAEHGKLQSALTGRIVDTLMNFMSVKLFARSRFEEGLVWQAQREEIQAQHRSMMMGERMKLFLGISSFLGAGIAITWYMLLEWQKGVISTGEVVQIFATVWNITMMTWFVSMEFAPIFQSWGLCKQALSLINEPYAIEDCPHASHFKATVGQITFENVSFKYGEEEHLFSNKNLSILPGQKVGLVGFSGSGKTTFAHLILRYYNLASGRILIDGQDIAKVTQDSLRSSISLIPQDVSLFHRTIMENIRYGRIEATDEEVMAAAKMAHCHAFIEKLPQGYHTIVGERGARLSGGQRQRIAIARAFLEKAPILILDEATSALDTATEHEIQAGLDTLMQGRTTLVIAHRLSTLAHMDRILVFDRGIIVEDGTPAELMERRGHYAHLVACQQRGLLPQTPPSPSNVSEEDLF